MQPVSKEVLKDTILSYQAELGTTRMKLFHARNALVLARSTLEQIKLNIAQVDLGGVIGILEKQEEAEENKDEWRNKNWPMGDV